MIGHKSHPEYFSHHHIQAAIYPGSRSGSSKESASQEIGRGRNVGAIGGKRRQTIRVMIGPNQMVGRGLGS